MAGQNQDHHHDEKSHLLHHSSSLRLEDHVPLYDRPVQRQRWNDPQILPHVNWSDLYWDLFFVSGAFNLAAALKECLNGYGILYFCACFVSVFTLWFEKTLFDSRYVVSDNLTLRMREIILYCILGTAVQHIRPAFVMSHTHENSSMAIFGSSLVLSQAAHFCINYDILMHCEGGPEAKSNSLIDMCRRVPSCALYTIATGWAIWDSVVNDDSSGGSSEYENHWPAILILLAFFVDQFSLSIIRYVLINVQKQDHNELFVPMNIEHAIHRLGEWVTLMLGESILALLIVEQSPGQRYYVTFYSGIITVTLFHYVYFRSSPFDPEDHATRRSTAGAVLFFFSIVSFSGSLVLVGCSFKMILHYYLEQWELQETDEAVDIEELEELQRSIARLYSWSVALAFFSFDFTLFSHRGVVTNLRRMCRRGQCGVMPSLVFVVDLSLILFQGLLSEWVSDLEVITVLGLAVVVAQVLLRTQGLRYFPVSKRAMEAAELDCS